jgi:prolyl oligopeptidase
MDMLRYQKFTEGASWCGEYGCSDNPTHFQNLLKYSPLHNIKKNTKYPAVLVMTAEQDDRVVPSHSYKYIAELQYLVGNNKEQTEPLLLFVQKDAGHGRGTPVWKSVILFY